MLYQVVSEAAERMKARKFPFPVTFGKERTQATAFLPCRVVVDYDTDAAETFEALKLQSNNVGQANPRAPFRCWQTAVARIYARSGVVGARQVDHFAFAVKARNMLVNALEVVTRGGGTGAAGEIRAKMFRLTGGRWVNPADLADSEVWAGVVYELRFQVDQSVPDVDWFDQAAGTAVIVAPEEDGLHLIPGPVVVA